MNKDEKIQKSNTLNRNLTFWQLTAADFRRRSGGVPHQVRKEMDEETAHFT